MNRMDQLAFRFETPNGKVRWDAPLFILRPLELQPRKAKDDNFIDFQDLSISGVSNEETAVTAVQEYKYFRDMDVLEDINQALFHGVAPKPNLATLPVSYYVVLHHSEK